MESGRGTGRRRELHRLLVVAALFGLGIRSGAASANGTCSTAMAQTAAGPGRFARWFHAALPVVGRRNVDARRQSKNPEALDFPMNRYLEHPDFPTVAVDPMRYGGTLQDRQGRNWRLVRLNAGGTVTVEPIGFTAAVVDVPTAAVRLPGHRYWVRIYNPSDRRDFHPIELYVPALSDGKPDDAALRRVTDALAALPYARLSAIQGIRVNAYDNHWDPQWRQAYLNFTRSAATGGSEDARRVIDFFPPGMATKGPGELRHELGHLVAEQEWSTTAPPPRWEEAMRIDGAFASDYALNSRAEDFAETVRVYLETDAGVRDPALRRRFLSRFRILDEMFGAHAEARIRLRAQVRRGAVAVTVGGAGAFTLYFLVHALTAPATPQEDEKSRPKEGK